MQNYKNLRIAVVCVFEIIVPLSLNCKPTPGVPLDVHT